VKIRDCLVYNGMNRKEDDSAGSSKGVYIHDRRSQLASVVESPDQSAMYLRLIFGGTGRGGEDQSSFE
jgi:hypothetical protein